MDFQQAPSNRPSTITIDGRSFFILKMLISTSNTQKSKLTNSPNWNWKIASQESDQKHLLNKMMLAYHASNQRKRKKKSKKNIYFIVILFLKLWRCGAVRWLPSICVSRGEDKTIFIYMCSLCMHMCMDAKCNKRWDLSFSVWFCCAALLLFAKIVPVCIGRYGLCVCCVFVCSLTIIFGPLAWYAL